jgi:hypothetical protein
MESRRTTLLSKSFHQLLRDCLTCAVEVVGMKLEAGSACAAVATVKGTSISHVSCLGQDQSQFDKIFISKA